MAELADEQCPLSMSPAHRPGHWTFPNQEHLAGHLDWDRDGLYSHVEMSWQGPFCPLASVLHALGHPCYTTASVHALSNKMSQ